QLLLTGLEAPDAQPVCAGYQERRRADAEPVEPARLVEVRRQIERAGVTGLIPAAVVVGRHHAEGVAPGRNIAVVSRAAVAGVHPVRVVAFELVFEADLLGREETQSRVTDRNIAPARRGGDRLTGNESLLVNADFLNMHRRGQSVGRQLLRVNCADALIGAEPDSAIAAFA